MTARSHPTNLTDDEHAAFTEHAWHVAELLLAPRGYEHLWCVRLDFGDGRVLTARRQTVWAAAIPDTIRARARTLSDEYRARSAAAGYQVVEPGIRATIVPLVLEYLATPAGRNTSVPIHVRTMAEEQANPSTCRHLVWHKGKDGNVYCGCGVPLAALNQRSSNDAQLDLFGGAA